MGVIVLASLWSGLGFSRRRVAVLVSKIYETPEKPIHKSGHISKVRSFRTWRKVFKQSRNGTKEAGLCPEPRARPLPGIHHRAGSLPFRPELTDPDPDPRPIWNTRAITKSRL